MIKVINIIKRFDSKIILDDINFEVADKLVAILGPTGAGKSVLLKIIAGLLKPDSGQVIIDKGETLGFVFQHSALFDFLTVQGNISLPLKECGSFKPQEIKSKLSNGAKVLNIDDEFLLKSCNELSGGERKIIAIARAIITDPTYILYDEPTTGFDLVTHDRICTIIKNLSKPGIIVSHNIDTIRKTGVENIYLLNSGKIRLLNKNELDSLTREQTI